MTIGLIDTSILIHLFRKHPAAEAWFTGQTVQFSVSSITWLEFIDGVPNKAGLAKCL